ncbi:unnamed protein product [Euphydryas editha]|uniref:Uncharacterized protein n=1 Tax=Euphydryas editha TaxID=104508 RepID=A0AAU9U7C4_EUPED|nr:unnamed protein product [Euphydryas editha]
MNTRPFIAIIYFHLVSVVLTRYIFDDNPNDFMAKDIVNLAKNRISGRKKFYKGINNQNVKLINERTVDSHFKVQKTSPTTFAAASVKYNNFNPIIRNAASPYNHRQLTTAYDAAINNQNIIDNKIYHNDGTYDEIKSTTSKNEMASIRSKNSNINKENEYDNQLNEQLQKHQEKSDYDKGDDMIKQQSYSQQADAYKTLQIENKDISRNTDVNSDRGRLSIRVNEDRRRLYNNLPKQEEHTKRHIMGRQKNNQQDIIGKENKKPVSFKSDVKHPPNLKTNNLEKSIKNFDKSDFLSRVGRYGLNSKTKTRPYAVFYVMNQDNFDQGNRLSEEVRSYVQEPVNYKRVAKNRNTEKTKKRSNYTVFRD